MFILRKLFKIMLLPVVFVLFFIKWLLTTSLKLTESIVGLLTMIVGAGIIEMVGRFSYVTNLCSNHGSLAGYYYSTGLV